MTRSIRILLVEENPADAELMKSELENGRLSFDLVRAENQQEFLFQLEQFQPDVVVADYSSSATNGEDLLRMVRQNEPDLPFIVVSPPLGEEHAVECMKRGATDYILKNNLKRLGPSVHQALKDAEARRARKKTEEAYKNSMNRYRDIVENASEIIYTMDLSGYFLHANTAALRTSGYSIGELWKMTYLDLILPEHRTKVKRHYMRQFLAHEPASDIEFPFQTKLGEVRWFSQSASPIHEGTTVVGYNVIAHDITARKNTEKK